MRWLFRFMMFWAISAPLFYLFGLPFLLDMLTKKTKNEAYTQCITLMTNEKQMGSPNSPLTQAQGEGYCVCTSNNLIFTKADLFDVVQKRQPATLSALAQSQAERCNRELQQSLGFLPAN